MSRYESFLVKRMSPAGQVYDAGTMTLVIGAGERIEKVQFNYRPETERLDPRHSTDEHDLTFGSNGRALPGFIDDCLPDDWGKKIIAAHIQKRFLNVCEVIENSGIHSTLGAIKIVRSREPLEEYIWDTGVDIDLLPSIPDQVWDGDLDELRNREDALTMLARGGSQAGGARPKLIVSEKRAEGSRFWLVKFNRSADPFNYARLEWACLELCRLAGLPVPATECMTLPSGRTALKVERFDVTPSGGRYHMLTFNSLLKNEHDQDDALFASYEALADIIRHYSYQPQTDLGTLFSQMLINMAVRNTDDHLRNFSLIRDQAGWKLSPIYDVVPSENLDTKHQLSCLYSHYLPSFKDAEKAGMRCFGLSATEAQRIAEGIKLALQEWPSIIQRSGMNGNDREFALTVTKHTNRS
ncbi:MAG TPA: type II toxin-antitoxin system HipA family toxin [Gammaproteobacteria bacterium]|uniref:type II toxin-antitoxin system HipA family toxin n=1 Tax=Thalassolituus sp. UBA2009 TaxID=1947658 RepID=UPI001A17C912|nr:HipA domain-containing protein [Thalassolituus sp. UBA2009]HIM96346.1 type II toxin-antitoxin system HipA family toxin [Gammaproteobacteria bacterium]